MNRQSSISRQLIRGSVVAAAVIAANLVAAEPGDVEATDSTSVQRIVPEAPAPIVGIAAPEIRVSYPRADEIVVPAVRRGVARMPEAPAIDVEAVRQSASAWLGNGVMTAPGEAIDVEAPIIDASAAETELGIDVPALERPELPAPPTVR